MADSVGRRSSVNSHRSSTRPRDSTRNSNPDVFSDEYAADMPPVSDGFRPSSLASPSNSSTASPTSPQPHSPFPRPIERRSVALQPSSRRNDEAAKKQRSQSVAAGLAPRNSFSLRHDAQHSDTPRRTASVASTANSEPFVRPLSHASSFSGSAGPSHPYAAYSQNTALNRSSTTNSNRRSEPSFAGPSRPYGMYPQGTIADTEAIPDPADITNVGFPSLRQLYTRRLGPDGEEADDIIGPDGHTEQLPPYSRYPTGQEAEAIPRKPIPAIPTSPGSSSTSSAEPPQTGISEASTNDRLLPIGSQSQGMALTTSSMTLTPEEGSTSGEKWTEKSKKRICGGKFPRWAVYSLIAFAIVVAAVVGGVVGKTVGRRNGMAAAGSSRPPDPVDGDPSTVVVTTTLLDASPVTSAPPNLPVLPTGQFIFPLAPAISVRSACLEQLEQKPCWACASGVPLTFEVETSDSTPTRVSLSAPRNDPRPKYGPVPPSMDGDVPVQLVTDNDQPGRGPAYLFQQTVNKTVILHEEALNSSAKAKRSWEDLERTARLQPRANTVAQPGQRPWVCFWNMTMLQGFVYVTVNASEEIDLSLASSAATATAAPTPVWPSSYSSNAPQPAATDAAYGMTASSPAVPTTTSAPADKYAKRAPGHWQPVTTATSSDSSPWPSGLPVPYPKAIKLEERRIPGISQPPYCQQMQVLDDYGLGPLDVARVQLDEDEPSTQHRLVYGKFETGHRRQRQRRRQRRRRWGSNGGGGNADDGESDDDDFCACVWAGQ